ncbi:UDP-N-acetylmuramoyl-tripeptide--D-alanyl-D-alanine ligase, partial [Actinotignum timonense]|uniref:UDP-N-acetylmuramoyl-tripeptide--D-alanyl-D- alanine ligase n=1 Tax=Actinotignum timonense TaxID=1870995 RepID=UPI002A837D26
MSSAEVIAAVGGTALAPLCDTEVTAAVIDTRAITPGALFAAVKGARVDANTLSGQARAAGASLILTEDGQAARAGGAEAERIIVVDDIPAALGRLARHNLELARHVNPDLRVIAVTGSVGKTTTKDLLAAICRERGDVVAPPGSLNNEIGLPLTVLRVGANTATLVAEMGADHIGNLAYLTSIAPPDIAVVLVVARAHLGEFGGIENVARAKAELVEGLREEVQALFALFHGCHLFLRHFLSHRAGTLCHNQHAERSSPTPGGTVAWFIDEVAQRVRAAARQVPDLERDALRAG